MGVTKVGFGRLGKPLQNALKVWVNQKDNSLGTDELWKMKTFLFIPREASCICIQFKVVNILHSSQAFPRHRTIFHSTAQRIYMKQTMIWVLFGFWLCPLGVILWINFPKFSLWLGEVDGPFLPGKLVMSVMTCQKKKNPQSSGMDELNIHSLTL